MSIRPPAGWLDGPSQETVARPSYSLRSSYLKCKVCEGGTLESKKVFRLSGPAVAIGFILLIPSVCGMLFSALILVGALTIPVPATTPIPLAQSKFDAGFRRSCAASVRQNYHRSGVQAPQAKVESYCECALTTYKETGSEVMASQECNQRAQDDTLDQVGQDVDVLYSDTPQQSVAVNDSFIPTAVLRFVGSVGAVAMGIGFFVGGLLGWLLVMRKRVLQCDFCGAVVNAS